MVRKILHLDLDAFFCSVEELIHPELKGKAFAVGGQPNKRGVISSCSYAARYYGVRSAMPTGKALQLCPHLLIVSGAHGVYGEYSNMVMNILDNISPLVQPVSIDEAFIDVSDMSQSAELIARLLQGQIDNDIHLPCSIGVATNKLVAKVANDFGKSSKRGIEAPRAITIIEPGEEAQFLAPLNVQMLWGIGPKTSLKLNSLGIKTIGDLASLSPDTLNEIFGKYGYELQQRAKGIDGSPVQLNHDVKSVSNEITFDRDIIERAKLAEILLSLSDKVGRRLRKNNFAGNTIHIKIRYDDFSTTTRQVSLNKMTNQDREIFKSAIQLFDHYWEKGRAIRLLGVGVSGLGDPVRQLNLWDQKDQKEQKILEAMDQINQKYGKQTLQRASRIISQKSKKE